MSNNFVLSDAPLIGEFDEAMVHDIKCLKVWLTHLEWSEDISMSNGHCRHNCWIHPEMALHLWKNGNTFDFE